MPSGYAAAVEAAGNYHSGDDYIVEFLGYRFSFNSVDFEERVTAAAVRLGLVSDPELDEDETADLVELVERDAIGAPRSPLGEYLVRHWDTLALVRGESLVYWLKKLVFRSAWLDHRVKEGLLEVDWDDERQDFTFADTNGLRARAVVWAAAVGATAWGIAGLTVLPRLDVAGAFGVPLLLVFLWRSRARATYAGVFLAVAALELYGTSIGTWRWASTLPGLGIPDGNPPSGVASGYVWFDVMALLVAPWLVYFGAGTLKPKLSALSGAVRSSIRRREPIGTMSASGASSRASVT